MTNHIRIGNQTAFSATHIMEPLEFALDHGLRTFEWFSDKKICADGSASGWCETDMTAEERNTIRQIGEDKAILYTVHAPWQVNPLQPPAERLLRDSVDFARDIGADLVNLHLYLDQGVDAYVDALQVTIAYAASQGVRISIENTPLTGPADMNATFSRLNGLPLATAHVGMCLDIGHANLFAGTQNDYIRYLNELMADLPIIHLHLHENWGEQDSHLALFTGPARDNDSGIKMLIKQLRKRRYQGAMILEQWPQPPQLLVNAERRLRQMLGLGKAKQSRTVNKAANHTHVDKVTNDTDKVTIDTATDTAKPHSILPLSTDIPPSAVSFIKGIASAHAKYVSWRQRLDWIADRVSGPDFNAAPEQLVCLAIYLRFLGTGELSCEEDGRHFRPHHHADSALRIVRGLDAVTPPEARWLLRKIYPWLPSYDKEFQRSEPLTRIRDIAHRNDIPKELKREIKRRLQNKLHRCAGPEDYKTSSEILAKITAPGADYSAPFVEQYRVFHRELSEFFNASSQRGTPRTQGLSALSLN